MEDALNLGGARFQVLDLNADEIATFIQSDRFGSSLKLSKDGKERTASKVASFSGGNGDTEVVTVGESRYYSVSGPAYDRAAVLVEEWVRGAGQGSAQPMTVFTLSVGGCGNQEKKCEGGMAASRDFAEESREDYLRHFELPSGISVESIAFGDNDGDGWDDIWVRLSNGGAKLFIQQPTPPVPEVAWIKIEPNTWQFMNDPLTVRVELGHPALADLPVTVNVGNAMVGATIPKGQVSAEVPVWGPREAALTAGPGRHVVSVEVDGWGKNDGPSLVVYPARHLLRHRPGTNPRSHSPIP